METFHFIDVMVNFLLRKIFHGNLNEAISLAEVASFTFPRENSLIGNWPLVVICRAKMGKARGRVVKKLLLRGLVEKSETSPFYLQLRGLLTVIIIFIFLSPAGESQEPSKCYGAVFSSNSGCGSARVKNDHPY